MLFKPRYSNLWFSKRTTRHGYNDHIPLQDFRVDQKLRVSSPRGKGGSRKKWKFPVLLDARPEAPPRSCQVSPPPNRPGCKVSGAGEVPRSVTAPVKLTRRHSAFGVCVPLTPASPTLPWDASHYKAHPRLLCVTAWALNEGASCCWFLSTGNALAVTL